MSKEISYVIEHVDIAVGVNEHAYDLRLALGRDVDACVAVLQADNKHTLSHSSDFTTAATLFNI